MYLGFSQFSLAQYSRAPCNFCSNYQKIPKYQKKFIFRW